MSERLFSDLTRTQQVHFADRLSDALPFTSVVWFKKLVELNPVIKNTTIKNTGWAFICKKDFLALVEMVKQQDEKHQIDNDG
jgi:hypothetical protein